MPYFETEFVNKRKSPVHILEGAGRTLLTLEPGKTKFVESKDASTSYAPFYKVVFKENGEVEVKRNSAWTFPNPFNLLVMEILNIDGAACEGFYLAGGELVHCFKGIPRYVGVRHTDPAWATVERVEIKLIARKVREGDLVVKKTTLEHVKTLRSKKEVKAIEQRLLAEATEKAKHDLARRFPWAGVL